MTNYIQPTKQNPVFQVICQYSGFTITENTWKMWATKTQDGILCGDTSAIRLSEAMEVLFNYIKENTHLENSNKFIIEMIDGSLNKYGEAKRTKCFTYSVAQAKRHNEI